MLSLQSPVNGLEAMHVHMCVCVCVRDCEYHCATIMPSPVCCSSVMDADNPVLRPFRLGCVAQVRTCVYIQLRTQASVHIYVGLPLRTEVSAALCQCRL